MPHEGSNPNFPKFSTLHFVSDREVNALFMSEVAEMVGIGLFMAINPIETHQIP